MRYRYLTNYIYQFVALDILTGSEYLLTEMQMGTETHSYLDTFTSRQNMFVIVLMSLVTRMCFIY